MSNGGKSGSLKRSLVRWWMGYQAIAFIALIPIMSYHVIAQGQPKKILLFCIPCYVVLAWGCYQIYRALSK
jgi:ABC-type nitrate/sulfonate/bicarbonate transport system permease component